jgi:hypothetical protein
MTTLALIIGLICLLPGDTTNVCAQKCRAKIVGTNLCVRSPKSPQRLRMPLTGGPVMDASKLEEAAM